MNLYIRFVILILSRLVIKKPIGILDECRSKFRVNFMDLDLNFHMNNGRYFSIMDLGRFDLMLKSKTFWTLAKKGYFPVITAQSIRFKKSFGLLQSFELKTQIESWDEKDFYIVQTFCKEDIIYAQGFVKARFLRRGKKGSIPTKEIFEEAGAKYEDKDLSDRALAQRHLETLLIPKDKN